MVSAEGATVTIEPKEFTMASGEWSTFTANISGTGTISLVFTPGKRFFLDEVLVKPLNATAITTVSANDSKTGRIYTLDGRNVGGDFQQLPRGLYIINGKKVVK